MLLPCPYLCDESEDGQQREKKTTYQRKRRATQVEKNDRGRDGQFTESEGEEEELSFTPAALNRENLILGENQPEEQGADNTQEVENVILDENQPDEQGADNMQEVDAPQDIDVDENEDVHAPPNENMAEMEAPVEQNDRPQHAKTSTGTTGLLCPRTTGLCSNYRCMYNVRTTISTTASMHTRTLLASTEWDDVPVYELPSLWKPLYVFLTTHK